jgi:hypothetical protein
MALFAAYSGLYREFEFAPRILFISATSESGKTTSAMLLGWCCQDWDRFDNLSQAVLFRSIETSGGVIILNDADWSGAVRDEMLGLLNSGLEKEGQVGRMERKEDGSFHLMRFSRAEPVPAPR